MRQSEFVPHARSWFAASSHVGKQLEAQARRRLDRQLRQACGTVQDLGTIHMSAGPGVAERELPTAAGLADDGLFLGNAPVGVIEAGNLGANAGDVKMQTLAYASGTLPGLQVPIQPLPIRDESMAVETFFSNGRDPDRRHDGRAAWALSGFSGRRGQNRGGER